MRLPMSPYKTRQEEYRDDPWKMLMVCFMLNQTSHKQVDQVRHIFFHRFPDAKSLVEAEEQEIADMIKPLGFYNKRAKAWKEFSLQWIKETNYHGGDYLPLDTLANMRGVGKYALDSWKVFQLYQYNTPVEDHVLNWYVEWAVKEEEEQKRLMAEYQPYTVYYMHFVDERHIINNWNVCRDYACCVMARTYNEAIEKTKEIALNQQWAKEIKIIGIGHGKEEWTKLPQPLTTDEQMYREQAQSAIERARVKRIDLLEGQNLKYKFER